jgi:arabinofuranosyltransferase
MPRIDARWWLALVLCVLCALATVLFCAAFQGDDAFITFRTVQNAWQGRGLTWNPGERVQAYTHPLWMLLALVCYGISGECYFSVLALAMLLALAAALLLLSCAARADAWAATRVLLLASSLAVVNYAVCGLENPLLFALLIGFVLVLRQAASERLGLLSLLVAWRSRAKTPCC